MGNPSLLDGNDGIAPGGDDRVEEPGQKGLGDAVLKRQKNVKQAVNTIVRL